MIELKSILKLATGPHPVRLMGTVVFDGRNAISVAHSRDAQPWWAGVPCAQPALKGPVAVPVDAIKAHFLRSRHLRVGKDHLHNGTGMRTEWDKKTDWTDALTLLPGQPEGTPVQFELDLDSLDRVLIAAGDADIRGALNGVLLDLTAGRIVGCDGSRLHVFDRRVPKQLPKKGQGALHVLLPKAAAKWLLHSADQTASVSVWQLGAEQPLVLLRTNDGLVYTKAIVGKFPDYLRVMKPESGFRQWALVNPGEFSDGVASMEKLHALEKPKLLSVGVHWGEGRIYAGTGPNFVPFQHTWGGPNDNDPMKPETIFGWYFPRYLADLADCVSDKAHWCLSRPADGRATHELPLAVFEADFSAVLMPQRMGDHPPTDKPAPKTAKSRKPARQPAKVPAPAPVPSQAPEQPAKGPKPAQVPSKVPASAPVPSKAPEKPVQGPKPSPSPAPTSSPAPVAKVIPIRRSLKGETVH